MKITLVYERAPFLEESILYRIAKKVGETLEVKEDKYDINFLEDPLLSKFVLFSEITSYSYRFKNREEIVVIFKNGPIFWAEDFSIDSEVILLEKDEEIFLNKAWFDFSIVVCIILPNLLSSIFTKNEEDLIEYLSKLVIYGILSKLPIKHHSNCFNSPNASFKDKLCKNCINQARTIFEMRKEGIDY